MDEQKLREYFDFDEADLVANRKGHLSEKQLEQVGRRTRPRLSFELIAGCVLFLVAGAGIFAAVRALLYGSNIFERIIFGSLFGLLWPYVWGKMGVALINFSRPKQNVRVKMERGRLTLSERKSPDIISYYELTVGARTVEVENDLTGMVTQGDQYAMYFLDKTKGILSLEHISKGK